ncbi:TauD/TfdA family dioxygenase [Azospirillum largimobile]
MLSSLGPDDLPYATRYGDGSPIPDSVIAEINQAYEAEKVQFPWREGDVMLLDNVAVAHAREPYIGDRMVYVAMGEILPEC